MSTELGAVRAGSSGNGTGGGISGWLTSTTRGGGTGMSSGCATTVWALAPKHADVNMPHIATTAIATQG